MSTAKKTNRSSATGQFTSIKDGRSTTVTEGKKLHQSNAKTLIVRSTTTGRFVVGATPPTLSESAKKKVDRQRPSNRAVELMATAKKAKVNRTF